MKNNGRRVRIANGELIARFLQYTDFNLPLRSVFFYLKFIGIPPFSVYIEIYVYDIPVLALMST
nr:MAG TPA: hypothetical protein [Caudoviricetes sp.]